MLEMAVCLADAECMEELFGNDDLVSSLLPAVEQQLVSAETPFVKLTYERLLKAGEEEAEAKKMIALCLADESNRMYIDKRDFDLGRYVDMLKVLPTLPEGV